MIHETDILDVFGAFALLARWGLLAMRLSLRRTIGKSWAYSVAVCSLFGLATGTQVCAFTTVTISTAAPAGLEQHFIADTTNQYIASVKANPFFANTYQMTLFGYQGNAPIQNASAMDACLSQGFADGMDEERYQDLKTLQDFQNVDIASGTCAGTIVDTGTFVACQYVYNLVGNGIIQRWGNIYSSTGSIVAP